MNSLSSKSLSVRYIKEHSAIVGQKTNVLGNPVWQVRMLSANISQSCCIELDIKGSI